MKDQNYPHIAFLTDNKEELDKLHLPVLLQQRLSSFDDLHADLDNMTPEHRQSMETALEALSHELMEDLEDELAELIEHNALPGISKSLPVPDGIQERDPGEEIVLQADDIEPEIQADLPLDENQGKVNDPLPNDERIIKNLVDSGRGSVSRADLVRLGFQGDTSLTTIKVGSFLLHRYRYEVRFTISMLNH